MTRLFNEDQYKTKNDVAWEKIFQDYSILEIIAEVGSFEISSATINKYRESRLMAKFDHSNNLPKIFKAHHLSILPISRSKYIIGHFDAYLKVNYDSDLEATLVDFPPSIESIDPTNLYSESSALSCAFNTNIIHDLLDSENVFYTVFGRMSTGIFNFSIKSLLNFSTYKINVNNSQCEIDGGFESDKYLLLIEAKLYEVSNFLIRQIYYPYRLWSSKTSKEVIVGLMTYSNSSNTFSFFIYKFDKISHYNSIRLIAQKKYILAPEVIQREDISKVFSSISIVSEPLGIPFPQADEFGRVIDLLTLLLDRELTKEEIALNYQFDPRQVNYYTDAARYLGLADKCLDQTTKEVTFCLTTEGRSLLNKRYKNKILSLAKKILEHQVFYKTFEYAINNGTVPNKNETCKIITLCKLGIGHTTISRRSSTVRRWIEWIISVISD